MTVQLYLLTHEKGDARGVERCNYVCIFGNLRNWYCWDVCGGGGVVFLGGFVGECDEIRQRIPFCVLRVKQAVEWTPNNVSSRCHRSLRHHLARYPNCSTWPPWGRSQAYTYTVTVTVTIAYVQTDARAYTRTPDSSNRLQALTLNSTPNRVTSSFICPTCTATWNIQIIHTAKHEPIYLLHYRIATCPSELP